MTSPALGKDKFNFPIQVLKPSTVQNAATNSATSTPITNNVSVDCCVIRVVVTTDSYVQVGATPVAANTSMYMVGGVPEYFRIDPGRSFKVAALAVTTAGILSVTEMV